MPVSIGVQQLLDAIPTAEDSHVITSDYHNSLRAAVRALAGQLGSTTPPSDVTLTYAPNFQAIWDGITQEPAWALKVGIAYNPDGNNAMGWFPVQMPNGVQIKSMSVTGERADVVLSAQVQLMRQTLTDATVVPLMTIRLNNTSGIFKTPETEVTGASPEIIAEFRKVDYSKYQYFVKAEIVNDGTNGRVDLYSIQITYSQ